MRNAAALVGHGDLEYALCSVYAERHRTAARVAKRIARNLRDGRRDTDLFVMVEAQRRRNRACTLTCAHNIALTRQHQTMDRAVQALLPPTGAIITVASSRRLLKSRKSTLAASAGCRLCSPGYPAGLALVVKPSEYISSVVSAVTG